MDRDDRTHVIAYTGDVGIERCQDIIDKLPEPTESLRVVIDLSNANSIDSSVIAVIMAYRRKLISAGGDPFNIVVIPSPRVMRILELTGVPRFVTVIPPKPGSGA